MTDIAQIVSLVIVPTGNCAWMLAAPLPFQLKTEFYATHPMW